MIHWTFALNDIEQLHYERFHHPHPRVQRKMEALYLKSQGYPHWEIAQLIRVTEPTLLSYFRDYQAGGVGVPVAFGSKPALGNFSQTTDKF